MKEIILMHKFFIGYIITLLTVSVQAAAHEDMIAPLAAVEKVYSTPEPFGEMRITYSGVGSNNGLGLTVECNLFRGSVPEVGLEDLPRPVWGDFFAAYSTASYGLGGELIAPYVYIQVPLRGPAGVDWDQTWATFHFDQDGKLTRKIKQFVTDEAENSIRVIWKEWRIGSGSLAEAILESDKNE